MQLASFAATLRDPKSVIHLAGCGSAGAFGKARSNAKKHGVAFAEAVSVFADPLADVVDDSVHAERSPILGESGERRPLVIVFEEREDEEVQRCEPSVRS